MPLSKYYQLFHDTNLPILKAISDDVKIGAYTSAKTKSHAVIGAALLLGATDLTEAMRSFEHALLSLDSSSAMLHLNSAFALVSAYDSKSTHRRLKD
ncbi:hypothetical protein HY29_15155 [Hyphomonas beringensis]|uniref:Uncharacterized protein n=1 Tax=Hyphomonas beringensis TaxID=1280946 RepID=A0A062U1R4_9PROT|nr:hypothetical protein [Hyphomonas beringensis]KCZ54266.1 hypothetical protein HY29_15155 [Hyphomonas beringensis]